jgi:hypothetical protein
MPAMTQTMPMYQAMGLSRPALSELSNQENGCGARDVAWRGSLDQRSSRITIKKRVHSPLSMGLTAWRERKSAVK